METLETRVDTVKMRRRIYQKAPNIHISPGHLGYLAGLVDGEGSIFYQNKKEKGRLRVAVDIANTSLALMEWLLANVGGKVYWSQPQSSNHSPSGHWKIYGANARLLLETIWPHLIIKRAKAKEVLAETVPIAEGLRRTGHNKRRYHGTFGN